MQIDPTVRSSSELAVVLPDFDRQNFVPGGAVDSFLKNHTGQLLEGETLLTAIKAIDPILTARLDAMTKFASTLLTEADGTSSKPYAEAILFYGSYVRGKAAPNDVDVFVATKVDLEHGGDYMYKTQSPTETKMAQFLTRAIKIPDLIDGIKVQGAIGSDPTQLTSEVSTGPSIVFVRGHAPGTLQIIGDLSGKSYLHYHAMIDSGQWNKPPIVKTWGGDG